MSKTALRIAMWSGPRNISTALMRAFENREDCVVWDEPFYGFYLDASGSDHPGAAEVIADQGTDSDAIIARCIGDVPGDKPIFYQKHMTLHLLAQLDPDIGFMQQAELFDEVRNISGHTPLVIDSREFLLNPRAMLEAICDRFYIEFSDKMLHWPPGPRASDGVWARYWYDSVWRSTGFAGYRERSYDLDDRGREIAQQARPFYEDLHQFRLQP